MNREYIINAIEEMFHDEATVVHFDEADIRENAVDLFMKNTAIRLINTYKNYCNNLCGTAELFVSVRNFMLVFQTALKIDHVEIPKDNAFGIYVDSAAQKYYAAYDIPDYIRYDSFVKEAYVNAGTQELEKETRYFLKTNGYIRKITGYDCFKSLEQKLCVYGALNTPAGFTTLVSMPTGGGKSLVTQALGYEAKGLSIVIVPTVSLAMDQERTARNSIKCAKANEIFCYYNKVKNFKDISDAMRRQTVRLLFISPEALIKNEQFRQLIQEANNKKYIKNIIIDEAHVVVSWGDFFRIDYQCLGPWRNELLKSNPAIRTYLLSATYRDDTVNTLKKIFAKDGKWIEIRCDSLRREPRYILEKTKNFYDKRKRVLNLVNILPRPMILYVNAPFEARKWKAYLESQGYGNVKIFTGETGADERKVLIDGWNENKYDLMIATSAFGVGVDKPDVRSILHLYIPENPDSYYQELGRGGRDGLPSLSVMCIEEKDLNEGEKHITKVLTKDTFFGRWWSMYTNPRNQWQGGLIAMMASTKPNYNKINYFEEGNETDEKWNINVLLLLSRCQQIDIVGLDLDERNRYIFTVKILNDLLTQNTEETKELFETIRAKEVFKAQSAFKLIRNAIENKSKLCWSGMFSDTYPLVSEYCSGCDCHENRVADELHRFPLLVDVVGPEKQISAEISDFFANTNEALIISNENWSAIIHKYKPSVVVCEEITQIEEIAISNIIYMNFAEFRELQLHDKGFYISGLIMLFYSGDDQIAKVEYQGIYQYTNRYPYVIHVSKKDFVVSNVDGKRLSEQVKGAVIS